ncbi:MAG TPA: hypothetical protein VM121_04425 [Acidimicrobiales bacterium]|nr:hypothetical protein [Acidimicrobiales bacterium]
MRTLLLGAFSWDPQVKGALYVLIAIIVLPGSAYLLLMTNVGARLGIQLAAAGFFGWMTVMGGVWWFYGKGPVGDSPTWKAQTTVIGDISVQRGPLLTGFPNGWDKLEITSPEVADATPVAEGELVGSKAPFKAASDLILTGAAQKGGEKYGPLGLDFRPFDLFHKPRHMVIQAQQALKPEVIPGQPPPKAAADPSAPTVSVLMVRDLGNLRLRPALVCVFSLMVFGALVYRLHVRDKELAASRG